MDARYRFPRLQSNHPTLPSVGGWMDGLLSVCVRDSEVPKYLRYRAGLGLGPGLEMPAVTNT